MKDLTFMNDGNQTYLAGNMVNLEKHRTIMGAVLAIRSSQQSLYNFDTNPLLRKYCEVHIERFYDCCCFQKTNKKNFFSSCSDRLQQGRR